MSKYGQKVTGVNHPAKVKAGLANRRGNKFGSRVLARMGVPVGQKAETPVAPQSAPEQAKAAISGAASEAVEQVKTDPIVTSMTELESTMEGNPALYEALFLSELSRAKPRKGAFRLFLDHEKKNENRDERITQLQALLKG